MRSDLKIPEEKQWRQAIQALQEALKELWRSPKVVPVARRLFLLRKRTNEAAELFGIDMEELAAQTDGSPKQVRVFLQKCTDKPRTLKRFVHGRNVRNAVKEAILEVAEEKDTFTVDDVIEHGRGELQISRAAISSNLFSMARRGKNPVLECETKGTLGCKGEPAVYRLRR